MFGITFNTQVVVVEDKIADEIARLNREATKLKKTDIAQGIDLLKDAALLDWKHSKWTSTETMLRLPIFMQLGGKFEECLAEFTKIRLRVPKRIKATMHSITPLNFTAMCHLEISHVYDKMRVACKREKRHDLVADCLLRSNTHRDAWEGMHDALELEHKQERAASEARAVGRKKERDRILITHE